jgi:hypothetical protein
MQTEKIPKRIQENSNPDIANLYLYLSTTTQLKYLKIFSVTHAHSYPVMCAIPATELKSGLE